MSPTGLFDTAANPPSSWTAAPSPTGIFVTAATATTTAKVRLEWNNGQIANRWLQIQVLNTAQTGLPVTQVFYLGNLVGELNGTEEVPNALFVNNADLTVLNPIGGVATVGNRRDVDKNRFVLNSDGVLVRNSVNAGRVLRLITIPVAGSADEGRVNGSGDGGGSGFFGAPLIGGGSGLGGAAGNLSGSNASGGSSTVFSQSGTGTTAKSSDGNQPIVLQKSSGSAASNSTPVATTSASNKSSAAKSTTEKLDAVFSKFDELDIEGLI